MIVVMSIGIVSPVAAQTTKDQILDGILNNSRWYTLADKEKVVFVSFKNGSITVEAPLAKKDSTTIDKYYVTRWPISYKDIASIADPTELAKIKTSEEYETANAGKKVYTTTNNKLTLTLPIQDSSKDIYITIEPRDSTDNPGATIEDYKLSSSIYNGTSQVKADNFSDAWSDDAIADVSCIWTKDQNRVELTRWVNTALNATKVEIYNRPNETQWDMTLKGTVNINDKSFVVDTEHREIQLFRLKPIDANGAMVGNEIQYICKPDVVTTTTTTDTTTTPEPSVPVTPHTGPKETIAFIAFISLLAYVIYRKAKA